ncbi:MAG: hypothetical protein HRT47_01410 [Candidatus Caenarcaniphilales bacterium]|nr:hypothetical protein [Candidatus Caenarcaniphilales bacterium]
MSKIQTDSTKNFGLPYITLGGKNHLIQFNGTAKKNAEAFEKEVRAIEVRATQACYIKVGDSDVVATNADTYLAANDTRRYGIDSNNRYISALRVSSNGDLRVTEGKA